MTQPLQFQKTRKNDYSTGRGGIATNINSTAVSVDNTECSNNPWQVQSEGEQKVLDETTEESAPKCMQKPLVGQVILQCTFVIFVPTFSFVCVRYARCEK